MLLLTTLIATQPSDGALEPWVLPTVVGIGFTTLSAVFAFLFKGLLGSERAQLNQRMHAIDERVNQVVAALSEAQRSVHQQEIVLVDCVRRREMEAEMSLVRERLTQIGSQLTELITETRLKRTSPQRGK